MKLLTLPRTLALALAFTLVPALSSEVVIQASETPRLNGRVSFSGNPGGGDGSLNALPPTTSLPQKEVRVGPTQADGIGLGYLIAFQTDGDQRNELLMAGKVELVLEILKTAMGGSPEPLTVALLQTTGGADPKAFAQFGAWNNAESFKEVDTIDGDPSVGEVRFDVTDILAEASPPTANMPTIFFAIYSPAEKSEGSHEGRHVIFGGQGEEAPKLVVSE